MFWTKFTFCLGSSRREISYLYTDFNCPQEFSDRSPDAAKKLNCLRHKINFVKSLTTHFMQKRAEVKSGWSIRSEHKRPFLLKTQLFFCVWEVGCDAMCTCTIFCGFGSSRMQQLFR